MSRARQILSESHNSESTTHRLTRIETAVEAFMVASEARDAAYKAELSETNATINRLAENVERKLVQIESGRKINGSVVIGALALLCTIIGSQAYLYISPIKMQVDTIQQQVMSEFTSFDTRLQREMRQLNDVLAERASGLTQRMEGNEKRIDDVTYRVDRRADDERRALFDLQTRHNLSQSVPK